MGGNSSLVSPESSVGGLSEHRYQWHSHPVAEPGLVAAQSTPAYESDPLERLSAHEEPRVRHQLPDLDSSQPGPIEIDTSLLYTPQSGNSSTDVSHSGELWQISAVAISQCWSIYAVALSCHLTLHCFCGLNKLLFPTLYTQIFDKQL